MNSEGVAVFLHAGAAFCQFGAQSGDAFTFLDAETADVGECGDAWRERSEHDGGHDAVGQFGGSRIGGFPWLPQD